MSYSVDHRRNGARSGADGQSLLRYYRILRERWWLIVACTVLVFAAAAVYVKTAPRSYQATAEMEVQAASPNDAVLSTLPVLHQTGDPTGDVLTAASLVTTPAVATAVDNALHLKISSSEALGDIQASPVGAARLVAVQATASSPKLAQELANAFVQQTAALSTARMHAAINSELPRLRAQLTQIPPGQRYGPGSLGQLLDELEQLQFQNDPTLALAADASLPTSASSPKVKLSLAAGLLGGLLLGIGAAFAFHALDPRLRREEQLRDLLPGLPILSRIPRESQHGHPAPLLPTELSLTAHEGYRTLRATLAARGTSSESRAFLVTGSAPAEGKSTTAINLALALAQGGGRVILIEADMRKPTFAAAFGLESYYGFEQVLIGEIELSHALTTVVFDGFPLRVLAAHPSGVAAADRLSMAVCRKLVNDAKALADFVVIDSPPLITVIDALPFAQLADEVVIVARLDRSRLSRLAELEELLSQHGASGSGLVLIGAGAMRHTPYYYGGDESSRRRRSVRPEASGSNAPEPRRPGTYVPRP